MKPKNLFRFFYIKILDRRKLIIYIGDWGINMTENNCNLIKNIIIFKISKHTKSKILFLVILFCNCGFFYCKCEKEPTTNSNDKKVLIADAGPDLECSVGNYVVIDGSKSNPGQEGEKSWYLWDQDPGNPESVFLFSGIGSYHSIQKIGFLKEGHYTFTLKIKSGEIFSNEDKVNVTVYQRENFVIKDPRLEIYIRFALKNTTGNIDFLALDSLSTANILVKKVLHLDGIENCINLKYLSMSNQRILNLSPLKNLNNLNYLQLDQNRIITDVNPLSNLTKLLYLNLDSNDINDISSLSELTQLKYLNIMFNPVDDISVVERMNNLEELYISNSPIGNINAIKNHTQLQILWLSKCQIKDISPIEDMNNLIYLFLEHNEIVDISALENLKKLERLYLADNKIDNISSLKYLEDLELIALENNNITNILPLVQNIGLTQGNVINLNANPLDEISVNEYIPQLRNRGINIIWSNKN